MIVVFGANGRTGREIVREAKKRGISIRAVAKNDLDTEYLTKLLHVNEISFADADHKESIFPVLKEASAVISCIDARTSGWGAPSYEKFAAANIVNAAHECNIPKILHLSVMGAYRWSPNLLNRETFHLDLWVRRSSVPWTMLRVSCYHDEVIEGHVCPPDGGLPHPFKKSSRYSPASRRDVARAVLDIIPDLIPSRTWLLGGPEVFTGAQLTKSIAPYKKGSGARTTFGPLPNGDVSVSPESSLIMVGAIPQETLAWALDPKSNPLPASPFWNRDIPEYHPSDTQESIEILSTMNRNLRYALHRELIGDLQRVGVSTTTCTLDFSQASFVSEGLSSTPHKSHLQEIDHIRVIDSSGDVVLTSGFTFLHDDLSDVLHIWWNNNERSIPTSIWEHLDLGTRRRLHHHPVWQQDPLVRDFISSQHKK